MLFDRLSVFIHGHYPTQYPENPEYLSGIPVKPGIPVGLGFLGPSGFLGSSGVSGFTDSFSGFRVFWIQQGVMTTALFIDK